MTCVQHSDQIAGDLSYVIFFLNLLRSGILNRLSETDSPSKEEVERGSGIFYYRDEWFLGLIGGS